MSQKLYYERVKPSRAKSLGCGLKWAIQRQYFSGMGTDVTFGSSDIPFLRGVQAASQEKSEQWRDCEILIEEIKQSPDGVRVWVAE
jgi:hypothetical protein